VVAGANRMASWDDAPLPYQSLDGDGCIRDVNAHWTEFSGYTALEAIGRAYSDFVPEEHLDYFYETFALFSQQGFLNGRDCFFRRKDGTTRNVLIYGRMVPSDDGVVSHCMLVDVTAHRETERLLGESEERFRNLFELAPNPIFVHDGRELMLANSAAAEFLGHEDPNALLGTPVMDLVDAQSRDEVAERVERMMTSDVVVPMSEEAFLRKDGCVVHGDTVASPVVIGGKRLIQVAAIDLTARKHAEDALRESEERYRELFNNSGDGIVVHDGRKVLFANPAQAHFMGFDPDEDVAGLEFVEFVHPDSREIVARRTIELIAHGGSTAPLEVRMLRRDGSVWEAEVATSSLSIEGERVLQTTFRDLTERKRTENELARYRTELERLVEERTQSLQRVRAELESVTAVIARTVELRDPYTAGHQRRVAELSVALARQMGMSAEATDAISVAAAIHDIGKVSVPAEILSKPGRFSALEFELVKTHALAGYEIVASAQLGGSVAEMVGQHHERLDGSGYPYGLTSEHLLPGSCVLMVADVVEAMSSHRPYRPAMGSAAALEEIRRGRGSRYAPDVVDACEQLIVGGFHFSDD